MSELPTLRRTRLRSRVEGVQGRLSIEFADEGETPITLRRPSAPRGSGFRRPGRVPAATEDPDPGAVLTAGPRGRPAVFHPLAYRSVIADWPLEWREHWGRRANTLEDTGLSWRDAEAQAFVEAWHRFRSSARAGQRGSPPAPTAPER